MSHQICGPPRSTIPGSSVIAVFIGNGLEFYDFCSYGLFAVYIGNTFFPSADGSLSLLLSLATFGIGFIFRPIGAIVLGTLGDRIGRKPAMLISFLFMGIGMLGLGLTPSYAQIGIAAPILAVTFRLIQGFALGGEASLRAALPCDSCHTLGPVKFSNNRAQRLNPCSPLSSTYSIAQYHAY